MYHDVHQLLRITTITAKCRIMNCWMKKGRGMVAINFIIAFEIIVQWYRKNIIIECVGWMSVLHILRFCRFQELSH